MTVVGIDLGTTNTVIAAVRDGRATALKDKHGNALLPSVVSFTAKGTPKVGHAAKARRTIDPENTVFSTKRLIGRTYDSEHVQKARTRLPFTLKGGPGKSTLVHCYGLDHTLPEISALVLGEAQAIAEARLGEPVTDAVITVPANFNDLQRAATKVAGRTAGLEVLRIINEPTAAALAYGFGKRGQERIAVYDFGGGTFDVTLLDLRDNVFEVLSTAGDTFLGGDDIDRAIMDQMAEELLRRHKIDASKDNLVREQLRVAAEKLKLELSTRSMAKTRVEELDFDFVMRRSEFEKLTEPFVARTLEVCQEAMEVAAISKKDLDQVLLVGGSTRIPLVRRRISSFFGKMPQSRINPDEVVAIGAAIQASALEAKQNKASIMPPPRPLAAARPSRPSAAGASATQMGLAGLRKTLSGTGRMSDRPPEQRQVSSVLSGLKSTPPGPNNPGMRASARPRTDKLTAEGERGGLSGLSPHPEQRRPLKDTSVGLGSASPPPRLSATSEADLPDFEDVTQVQKRPDQLAAERDRAADSSRFADARSKQGTLRGEPMFPAPQRPSSLPPSGDGSVTFDLEDLEGSENEFESLKDETTQIVEPNRANAEAAQLDSIADADDTGVGLPSPTRNPKIEELGDSALFAFEEEDDEAAELPSPGAGLPVRAAPPVPSPAFGGVASGKADRAAHGPAPAPATGLPAPVRKESVGLPQNAAELPLRARYRPQSIEPDSFEEPPDLPLVGAGLPLLGASLPTVGGLPLPSSPDATQSQRREAQTERNPAAPPAVPAFARASFGTPGARTVLPAPSVDELDELSVSAPLPTDDAEEQTEFDLQAHQRFAAGGVLDEGLSRTSWEGAPESVPPSHQSWGPATPPSGGAPLPTEHDQRRMPDEPLPSAPLLIDVTPLSLGVEVVGGYVDRLIERNSPVPCERTRTFATAQDNQQMVRVRVSQGEEGRFEANTVLGEIELTGIPPGPRGSVKVDVSFSLDESGMLQVSARDPVSGNAANARLMLAGVAP